MEATPSVYCVRLSSQLFVAFAEWRRGSLGPGAILKVDGGLSHSCFGIRGGAADASAVSICGILSFRRSGCAASSVDCSHLLPLCVVCSLFDRCIFLWAVSMGMVCDLPVAACPDQFFALPRCNCRSRTTSRLARSTDSCGSGACRGSALV